MPWQGAGAAPSDEEEENQPLDLSWPDSWRERITYILFLPIIMPLWLTLPDTRKASGTFTSETKERNSKEAICTATNRLLNRY